MTAAEAQDIFNTFSVLVTTGGSRAMDAYAAVAQLKNRSVSTVRLIVKNGGIVDPKPKPGRPRLLTHDHVEFLLDLLSENPTLTQKELRDRLVALDSGPEQCDETTIGRYLDGQLLSRKQIRSDPYHRNTVETKEKRYDYALWLVENMDVYNFVFIDETPMSMYHGRTTGYAREGQPVVHTVGARDTNRTVAMAVSERWGVVHLEVIEGSFNAQKFRTFLHATGTKLNSVRTRRPWCIILDNCSIHRPETCDEVLEPLWVQYKFLSPYSCELNPIELVFGTYKKEIRGLLSTRYCARLQRSYEAPWGEKMRTRNIILDKAARRGTGVISSALVRKCWGHVKKLVHLAILRQDL